MTAKKARRPGATETFSVSVDPETKRALRALADREFDGNLSALVTDFAEEARRRMPAGEYLCMHRAPKLAGAAADELEAAIDREVAVARKRRKRKRAADIQCRAPGPLTRVETVQFPRTTTQRRSR